MKYCKLDKEKIQKICLLRIEHPDMYQSAIAKEVGVNITSVHKYLPSEGLPTASTVATVRSDQLVVTAVIQLRKENPDMTLKAIGEKVGITGERVRQLLKREGLPTVSTNGHTTSYRVPRGKCKTCGDQIGLDKELDAKYCSRECIQTKGRAISFITCYRCGKVKSTSKNEVKWQSIKYKHTYCSRSCSSKAFWENISPEDRTNLISKRTATYKINSAISGECKICGTSVMQYGSRLVKNYCSKECRQANTRRRNLLRYYNNKHLK